MKRVFYLFVLVFLITSCEKEIEIPIQESNLIENPIAQANKGANQPVTPHNFLTTARDDSDEIAIIGLGHLIDDEGNYIDNALSFILNSTSYTYPATPVSLSWEITPINGDPVITSTNPIVTGVPENVSYEGKLSLVFFSQDVLKPSSNGVKTLSSTDYAQEINLEASTGSRYKTFNIVFCYAPGTDDIICTEPVTTISTQEYRSNLNNEPINPSVPDIPLLFEDDDVGGMTVELVLPVVDPHPQAGG